MANKKQIIIVNLIDWSKSFVDPNGSFYCGTQPEEKKATNEIIALGDLIVYSSDLHPIHAAEFTINGGLYPAHNIPKAEQFERDFVYTIDNQGKGITLEDKTLSPTLSKDLEAALKDRKTGIIVPRSVYFQGSQKPFCTPQDVEQTFGAKIVTDKEFLDGDFSYIIAPKEYFDATRMKQTREPLEYTVKKSFDVRGSNVEVGSGFRLEVKGKPERFFEGIPNQNYNVFTLIEEKYPEDQYDLVFVNTGVVEGICRLHTSVGLKEMFPKATIINIADATTPLAGIGLGYETSIQSRDACARVGKDIGIHYMTTNEFIREYKKTA